MDNKKFDAELTSYTNSTTVDDLKPNNDKTERNQEFHRRPSKDTQVDIKSDSKSNGNKLPDADGVKCHTCKSPRLCTHNLDPTDICWTCRKKEKFWYEKLGRHHPVDFLSRIMFPLAYIAYLLGYASVYDII